MEKRKTIYRNVREVFGILNHYDYNDIKTIWPEPAINTTNEDDLFGDIPMVTNIRKKRWTSKDGISTQSETTLMKSYGDITKTIKIHRITSVVEEEENKISLKVYRYVKTRGVGLKYFSHKRHIMYLTYNTKTKNFYYGLIQKKKKQIIRNTIRTNNFSYEFLGNYKHQTNFSDMEETNRIAKEIIAAFFNSLYERTGIKLNPDSKNLDGELYRFYLLDNGFICPDSYSHLRYFKIPKRQLRKENNPVTCIMKNYKIRGSKIRRILNTASRECDTYFIFQLYYFLGVDYFNKVNLEKVTRGRVWCPSNVFPAFDDNLIRNFETRDKKRIVSALNDGISLNMIDYYIQIIDKLKEHGHITKMKFYDGKSFRNEYEEMLKTLEEYTNGTVERIYNKDFRNKVQEPIDINGNIYYPVLLTKSIEYNEESLIQHNCVRTYVETPNCFIVSLRKESIGSEDRVTIEYKIYNNGLRRVQARKKFNEDIEEDWDKILVELDNKVDNLYTKEKLFDLPMMIKTYPTGKEIKYKGIFIKEDNLVSITPIWEKEERI